MEYSTIYQNVKVTVTDENTKFGWTVFFSNAPGSSVEVGNVKPLTGIKSKEVALRVAKKFIEKHRIQEIEDIDIYRIRVRLQLDDTWEYLISGGNSEKKGGFHTFRKAMMMARDRVKERIEEWEETERRHREETMRRERAREFERQIQLES